MSREFDKPSDKSEVMWRDAIQDCKKQIRQSKARVHQLEESIKVFTEKIKRNEPWPGEQQSATQN